MSEADVMVFTDSKLTLYYKILKHVYSDVKEFMTELTKVDVDDDEHTAVTTAYIAAQLALHIMIEYDRRRNRGRYGYRKYRKSYERKRRRW